MTFQRPQSLSFCKLIFPIFQPHTFLVYWTSEKVQFCHKRILSAHISIMMRTTRHILKGKTFVKQLAIPTHNCGCRKLADNVSKHHLWGEPALWPSTASSVCPTQIICTHQPAGGSLSAPSFLSGDRLLKVGTGQSRQFLRIAEAPPFSTRLLPAFSLHKQRLRWQPSQRHSRLQR